MAPIATFPPSYHAGNVRRVLERLKRHKMAVYAMPGPQEIEAALESLVELERMAKEKGQ